MIISECMSELSYDRLTNRVHCRSAWALHKRLETRENVIGKGLVPLATMKHQAEVGNTYHSDNALTSSFPLATIFT